jgi:protein-tyrosine kinase
MGKTHEALEWAEKEQQKNLSVTISKPEVGHPIPPRRATLNGDKEFYENLKINLLTSHPGKRIQTILFSSTCHGDGASTTAINFATALSKNHSLKVLLIDVNLRTPGLHEVYQVDRRNGLSEMITNNHEQNSCIRKVGPGDLYIITTGGNHSNPLSLFDSKKFEAFLKEAREEYDYILLDAPPIPAFLEARLICSKVDGVILVLGSGKTRRHVALRAKKEVEDAGGTILGVVLNRRKFHIPKWLYTRL